jgi:hypothetical protein
MHFYGVDPQRSQVNFYFDRILRKLTPRCIVQEIIITPDVKYCTVSFHIGPMPAIYASIPVICYDTLLVVLAIVALGKHLRERKELNMRPNAYVVMIVRYHVLYFVL